MTPTDDAYDEPKPETPHDLAIQAFYRRWWTRVCKRNQATTGDRAMRRIKMSVSLENAQKTEFVEIPDGWEDWSEAKQEEYLAEIAYEFAKCHIDYGAYVTEDES